MARISHSTEHLLRNSILPVKNLSRILAIAGFSILSGLFGMGLTWLVVAFLFIRNNDERLTKVMPALLTGGFIGLVIGSIISVRVAMADPETGKAVENKYFRGSDKVRIYFGAPICITTMLALFFGDKLLTKFGTATGAYMGLGIFMAILAISLFLYDRLPKKVIIPTGIVGWLITVLLFVCFGVFGLGALK
jgi:hypothetical protein